MQAELSRRHFARDKRKAGRGIEFICIEIVLPVRPADGIEGELKPEIGIPQLSFGVLFGGHVNADAEAVADPLDRRFGDEGQGRAPPHLPAR